MSLHNPPEDEQPILGRVVTYSRPLAPAVRNYDDKSSFLTKIVGTSTASATRVSESLDYEPIQNKLFYDRMKSRKEGKKKLYGYTGHTLAKFLVTFLTGILTGLFAVALTKFVGWITEWKLTLIEDSMQKEAPARIFVSFLWFWFIGSCLVSLATAMVQYWAPASAGGGVTLVMAYLNGNHVPNLLRFETLVTKFVGTVCAVSSGLPMGPEGPMVHIGACLASVITYMECSCLTEGGIFSCIGRKKEFNLKEKLKVLDDIVSDSDHREFVSAGVSAGISAAFGAPIGGVLFSMEEACSFWSRKTAWRCFIAASLSTFTIQLALKSTQHGMIAFHNLSTMDNKDWLLQLPFFTFGCGVAGLLGTAFNSLRMWLWKVRAVKTRHLLRILEVIGLVFLVSACGHFFGWAAGTCKEFPPDWKEEGYGLRFNCEEGKYNDVATLFLTSQHHSIIKLFSIGYDDLIVDDDFEYSTAFSIGGLALYVILYLILMSIGSGVAIPGGLFMPSIMMGAAWGCLWGMCLRIWIPSWNIQPGLYAILASTSVLAGVFRSSISLVVLVVEGTRGIEYLFGVIVAVVIANWVAHHIHHDGVYESELEKVGNVFMLRDEPPHRLFTLTAEAIMATGVYGFHSIESVSHILEVLRNTAHNGFPVFGSDHDVALDRSHGHHVNNVNNNNNASSNGVPNGSIGSIIYPEGQSMSFSANSNGMLVANNNNNNSSNNIGNTNNNNNGNTSNGGESGRLLGVIQRSQLLVLLERRHFCDAQGLPIGREYDVRYELELETQMRTYFRHNYTHARYVSATTEPLDSLGLDGVSGSGLDLSRLFIDLRPYMNRSPFTIRKDCSASRAHQAFVNLGLRHLLVADDLNHVVGIITRKDLDHAAGHGWWRVSHMAEPPKKAQLLAKLNGMPSVGFLKRLMGGQGASGGGEGGEITVDAEAGNAAVPAHRGDHISATAVPAAIH